MLKIKNDVDLRKLKKYAIGKPNYQNELQYAIEILQELLEGK